MISHRIPYPPDKGDKIRSYNEFCFLRRSGWKIHLCTFVDDPEDLRHVDFLKRQCESASVHRIDAVRRNIGMVSALFRGKPLSVGAFYRTGAQAYIDRVFQKFPIEAVFCFSSPTAEYLYQSRTMPPQCRRMMDLIDVDSDKWQQYGRQSSPPLRWIYFREARSLAAYEKRIAETFDATLLVSAQEAAFFRGAVADTGRIHALPNGVDKDFFHPRKTEDEPQERGVCCLVFCGLMDYPPNVDAVLWFGREVLPPLRQRIRNLRFDIVGARPTREIQELNHMPGIRVHGRVEDVRPYVWNASISIAPIRIARGIQNKVLEAMAMGRPVIASGPAFEGIDARPGRDLEVVEAQAEPFCDSVVKLWENPGRADEMGRQARRLIESRYDWDARLKPLQALLS